ncbi:unnamed protein product [Aphanomyces euteiches]|nr:hypothetical protein AeRB84_000012 [Aphanomyces euteiches]
MPLELSVASAKCMLQRRLLPAAASLAVVWIQAVPVVAYNGTNNGTRTNATDGTGITKTGDGWPSNTTAPPESKWQYNKYSIACREEDGCNIYATIYVAISLFVVLTIGMIYVIYKRRKLRQFIGHVHSPPLLEMNRGDVLKDDSTMEGEFLTTASPLETLGRPGQTHSGNYPRSTQR